MAKITLFDPISEIFVVALFEVTTVYVYYEDFSLFAHEIHLQKSQKVFKNSKKKNFSKPTYHSDRFHSDRWHWQILTWYHAAGKNQPVSYHFFAFSLFYESEFNNGKREILHGGSFSRLQTRKKSLLENYARVSEEGLKNEFFLC